MNEFNIAIFLRLIYSMANIFIVQLEYHVSNESPGQSHVSYQVLTNHVYCNTYMKLIISDQSPVSLHVAYILTNHMWTPIIRVDVEHSVIMETLLIRYVANHLWTVSHVYVYVYNLNLSWKNDSL